MVRIKLRMERVITAISWSFSAAEPYTILNSDAI